MNPIATWIFEIVCSLLPMVFSVLIQVANSKGLQITSTEFVVSSLLISVSTTTALIATVSQKRGALKNFWTAMTFYSLLAGTLFITIFLAISNINPVSWLVGIVLEVLVVTVSALIHRKFIWN